MPHERRTHPHRRRPERRARHHRTRRRRPQPRRGGEQHAGREHGNPGANREFIFLVCKRLLQGRQLLPQIRHHLLLQRGTNAIELLTQLRYAKLKSTTNILEDILQGLGQRRPQARHVLGVTYFTLETATDTGTDTADLQLQLG